MSIEQSFFIEIRFKNALEVRELIMTFVLLIHVKSIKNRSGKKMVWEWLSHVFPLIKEPIMSFNIIIILHAF